MTDPARMSQHVTLLAAFQIAYGVLGLLIAVIVFVSIAGGGMIAGAPDVIAITTTVGSVIAGAIAVVSVPAIFAGIGLLRYRQWGRIIALVVGCLSLLNIPIGTAFGVYTLWVLLHADTAPLFGSRGSSAASVPGDS